MGVEAATDSTKDATKDVDTSKDVKDKEGANPEAGKDIDPKKNADDVTGLKKALAAERKLREGFEKEKREAELSKLPELEQAKTKLADLEKENETLKTDNMRRQVAMELGLPWRLAKRIAGDTEQEMRDDGADLLKSFKGDEEKNSKDDPKNKRTPTNDAKKSGGSGGPGMNDILKALARR